MHQDTGYLSRDTDRGGFVFRDFLSEGFVNTYDVRWETAERIVFEHRETESAGGTRARMHLTFAGHDAYVQVLELAGADGKFSPCLTLSMKRSR